MNLDRDALVAQFGRNMADQIIAEQQRDDVERRPASTDGAESR